MVLEGRDVADAVGDLAAQVAVVVDDRVAGADHADGVGDLVEVRDDSFLVSEWGDEHELPFDLGFVRLGMKANANGVGELTQHFTDKGVEALNIGDSRAARRIIDGTREARSIVVNLRNMGRLPAPATV